MRLPKLRALFRLSKQMLEPVDNPARYHDEEMRPIISESDVDTLISWDM